MISITIRADILIFDTSKKKYYTYEYDNAVFETNAKEPENEVWTLYGLNLISRQANNETLYYM